MRSKVFYSILLIITWILYSYSNQSATHSPLHNGTLKNSLSDLKRFQIWQLDYYPDSIFINRSINDNSEWESSYAYNIQFSEDSCQFIGWHESWWNHLIKTKDNEFKTKDDETQYWELKFVSSEKLLMRQISFRKGKALIGTFAPYHKVDQELTLEYLDHKIAKDIFAGRYKVIFNDTLDCEKSITFNSDFGVKGIKGITSYCFETSIDCDFPVFNAFGLNRKGESNNKGFSFKFSGDTLLINDYKVVQNDGDFDHVEISKTRIIMIKK
jgi:hypothetical protein